MSFNFYSFLGGCILGFAVNVCLAIFILGLCMAAGRECPAPESSKLDQLETESQSKIKITGSIGDFKS